MNESARLKLAIRFLEEWRRGTAPAVADFLAQHGFADSIFGELLEEAKRWPAADAPTRLHERLKLLEADLTVPRPGSSDTVPLPTDIFDGRYREIRVIGEGGFGRVLLVEDLFHAGTQLALKVIKREHSASFDMEQRFRSEIQILRTLTHPGITQIFNDGKTTAGELYYTMSFVEGMTLEKVIAQEAPLKPERIVRIVQQILHVLEYAHARGVVHRDLKPLNLILTAPGTPAEQIKVLDFGIAKILRREGLLEHAAVTQADRSPGTPAYMSPEQMRGGAVDGRTDLYALGLIIYRMCAATWPAPGSTRDQIATTLAEGGVPVHLSDLVLKLLQQRKEDRPDTTEALRQLSEIGATQRKIIRILRRSAIGAGICLLLLIVGGGIYWLKNSKAVGDLGQRELARKSEIPEILEPPNDGIVSESPIVVKGLAYGHDSVWIEKEQIPVKDGRFQYELAAPEDGMYKLRVALTEPAEEADIVEHRVRVDTRAPAINELRAIDGNDPLIERGSAAAPRWFSRSGRVAITGVIVDANPRKTVRMRTPTGDEFDLPLVDGKFVSAPIALTAEGANNFEVTAIDEAKNPTVRTLAIVYDASPPELLLEGPFATRDALEVAAERATIAISGATRDVSGEAVAVFLDDQLIPSLDKNFSRELELKVGANSWTLRARDLVGNETSRTIAVTRAPPAPTLEIVLRANDIELADSTLPAHATKLDVRAHSTQDLVTVTVMVGAQPPVALERRADGAFATAVDIARDGFAASVLQVVFTATSPRTTEPVRVERTLHWAAARIPEGCAPLPDTARATRSGFVSPIVHKVSGIEFVLVEPGALTWGGVQHRFDQPYYMSRFEVTRGQFAKILNRTPEKWSPEPLAGTRVSLPATDVSWSDAERFCALANLALPTEIEWAYAALGSGAGPFPWGAEWLPRHTNARGADDGSESVAPVGSHPADRSWCGVEDMAGNVSEYCSARRVDDTTADSLSGGNYTSDEAQCRIEPRERSVPPRGNERIGFRPVLRLGNE
ncbi:MAG: protein kinase domain-containing protein [Planctomycetota bacterium]